jgi:alkylation response protein AidB-like acyl-CoA dehydrogenase
MASYPQDATARARSLAPLIESHAAEAERLGRLTDEVVQALRDTGLFWMNNPVEAGGEDIDLFQRLDVIEELSRADGSTGWAFMAIAGYTGFAGVGLGDDAIKAMFNDPENLQLAAGMANPVGRATPTAGGFSIAGDYRFGSGTLHADWITAGGPVGESDTQICTYVPRDRVEFRDNWDVLGLAGTGSVDYSVVETVVPEAFTFEVTNFVARRGGPSSRVPLPVVSMLYHSAVVLGITKRALEEVLKVVDAGKQRPGATKVVDQQMFQHSYALGEGKYRAARAYLVDLLGHALTATERGDEVDPVVAARFFQSCVLTHQLCLEVVDAAFYWAGSASLRRPHPLGRCLADLRVANQHVLVDHTMLIASSAAVMSDYRAGATAPTGASFTLG